MLSLGVNTTLEAVIIQCIFESAGSPLDRGESRDIMVLELLSNLSRSPHLLRARERDNSHHWLRRSFPDISHRIDLILKLLRSTEADRK